MIGHSARANVAIQSADTAIGPVEASDEERWFEIDPAPVLLLRADGLTANRRARRMLEPGGGLRAKGGHLAFTNLHAQACFAEALEKITSGAVSEIAVVLRCDDGRWRRLQLVRGDGPPVRVA